MSEHEIDDGTFEQSLGAQLHAAADGVDGGGVTRLGVASAAAGRRRRQQRTRAVVAGAAAAIAVVVGIAVASGSGDGGGEQITTQEPTTTEACVPTEGAVAEAAGWFRLTSEQAEALVDAGAITPEQADGIAEHAVLLTHAGLGLLADEDIGPVGQQIFDLGYEDAAGLELLRREGLLTPEQEAAIDDSRTPELDQAQADRVLAAYPDLLAINAGGQPFPTGGVAFAPAGGEDTTTTAPSSGCGG